MKFLFLFSFLCLFLFPENSSAAIIQLDKTNNYKSVKLCKDCRHFLPTMYGDRYDIGNHLGRCNLFGKMNVINGEIEHEYATIVRKFDDMCGINGTHFEKSNTHEVGTHVYPL
jgi:hypothetical protein